MHELVGTRSALSADAGWYHLRKQLTHPSPEAEGGRHDASRRQLRNKRRQSSGALRKADGTTLMALKDPGQQLGKGLEPQPLRRRRSNCGCAKPWVSYSCPTLRRAAIAKTGSASRDRTRHRACLASPTRDCTRGARSASRAGARSAACSSRKVSCIAYCRQEMRRRAQFHLDG